LFHLHFVFILVTISLMFKIKGIQKYISNNLSDLRQHLDKNVPLSVTFCGNINSIAINIFSFFFIIELYRTYQCSPCFSYRLPFDDCYLLPSIFLLLFFTINQLQSSIFCLSAMQMYVDINILHTNAILKLYQK